MSLYKNRNYLNSFYRIKNINRGAFGALKQASVVRDVLRARMFGKVVVNKQ